MDPKVKLQTCLSKGNSPSLSWQVEVRRWRLVVSTQPWWATVARELLCTEPVSEALRRQDGSVQPHLATRILRQWPHPLYTPGQNLTFFIISSSYLVCSVGLAVIISSLSSLITLSVLWSVWEPDKVRPSLSLHVPTFFTPPLESSRPFRSSGTSFQPAPRARSQHVEVASGFYVKTFWNKLSEN